MELTAALCGAATPDAKGEQEGDVGVKGSEQGCYNHHSSSSVTMRKRLVNLFKAKLGSLII